eukprot:TRINITY_DN7400_c1_g1_i12.p1 TRINITY_DN7400_c1_g1~~TRINITY_DN7400_c1_g1_i12.p1  ORF type:complete len:501 (-),score=95.64 TRINITY_DN7400_c1_g1_i12:2445-3908(-)
MSTARKNSNSPPSVPVPDLHKATLQASSSVSVTTPIPTQAFGALLSQTNLSTPPSNATNLLSGPSLSLSSTMSTQLHQHHHHQQQQASSTQTSTIGPTSMDHAKQMQMQQLLELATKGQFFSPHMAVQQPQQAQFLQPQAQFNMHARPPMLPLQQGFNPQLFSQTMLMNPMPPNAASRQAPVGFLGAAAAAAATAAHHNVQAVPPAAPVGDGQASVSQKSKDEDGDSEGNSILQDTPTAKRSNGASAQPPQQAGSKRSASSMMGSDGGDEQQEDPNERRRRKHNELEVKRRQRINEKFVELQELCSSKSDRRSVLQAAIDTISSFPSRLHSLEVQIQQYQQQLAAAAAGDMFRSGGPKPIAPLSSQRMGVVDFQAVYRKVSAPMAVMSLDGRFVDCNEAMCALFGKRPEEIEQTTMFGLANPKDLAVLFSKVQRLITGEDDVVVFDTFYTHSSSSQIPLMTIVYSVRDQGEIQSLLWIGVRTQHIVS